MPAFRSASRKWRIAERKNAMRSLWHQTCVVSCGVSLIQTASQLASKPSNAALSRFSWSPSTRTRLRTGIGDV